MLGFLLTRDSPGIIREREERKERSPVMGREREKEKR